MNETVCGTAVFVFFPFATGFTTVLIIGGNSPSEIFSPGTRPRSHLRTRYARAAFSHYLAVSSGQVPYSLSTTIASWTISRRGGSVSVFSPTAYAKSFRRAYSDSTESTREHSQVEPDATRPRRQKEQEQVLRRGLVETVHQRLPQVGGRTAVQSQETPAVSLGQAAKNVKGGGEVGCDHHLPRVVVSVREREVVGVHRATWRKRGAGIM